MVIHNIIELTNEIKNICENKTYNDLLNYDVNVVKLILYNIFDNPPNEIIAIIDKLEKKENTVRKQEQLRKLVVERDKYCIVSGLHPDCCEIAHIHPFCDCNENQKYDQYNVILISAHLHKLFDKYLWSINPNTCKIVVSNKCKINKSYQISQYDNKKINLPINIIPYLQKHYNKFIELDKLY